MHWLSIYIIIGLQKWLPFNTYFSLLWPCIYCMPLPYFMTVVNKQVANWLAIHTHWISFIFWHISCYVDNSTRKKLFMYKQTIWRKQALCESWKELISVYHQKFFGVVCCTIKIMMNYHVRYWWETIFYALFCDIIVEYTMKSK